MMSLMVLLETVVSCFRARAGSIDRVLMRVARPVRRVSANLTRACSVTWAWGEGAVPWCFYG